MRDRKFRGMDLQGTWYYGNLSVLLRDLRSVKAGSYISNSAGFPFAYAVRPETIGQNTGLKDKNGKEIYEGDIVSKKLSEGIQYLKVVEFKKICQPGAGSDGYYHAIGYDRYDKSKIVGNIYENPELLKDGAK